MTTKLSSRWWGAPAVAIVLSTGVAAQDTTAQGRRCGAANEPIAIRIAACTEVIETSRPDDPRLAIAHYNRAVSWAMDGKLEQAIADYDAAISLKPDDSAALQNRGAAWADKGEFDMALADYNTVIRINPESGFAYFNRGVTFNAKGDHERAIEDFSTANRLLPGEHRVYVHRGIALFAQGSFALAANELERASVFASSTGEAFGNQIWAYVARLRNGLANLDKLRSMAAKANVELWPGPVVRLLSGEMSEEATRIAANHDDPSRAARQKCTAEFFIGQVALAGGRITDGIAAMREAALVCPSRSDPHYILAVAELRRAGETPPAR